MTVAGGCGPGTSATTTTTTTVGEGAAPVHVAGAGLHEGVRDGEGRIRPEATAGLYWQPYVTCDACATPAAVVAYVTADAPVAQTIMRTLDGRLGLGRPWAVHTDELGLGASAPADDGAAAARAAGIAIVIGTFTTRDAAVLAAARSDAIAGVVPRVLERAVEASPDQPRHVTQIDRGGSAPAWRKADLDAAVAALNALEGDDAPATLTAQDAWIARQLQRRGPACTVLPGEVFVVGDDELDWYRHAPVRCPDGAPAYVAWTRTLLGHAVIVDDGAGGHRLSQVVGAACDSPIIETWRYDRDGRHPLAPGDDRDAPDGPRLALGGC